MHLGVNLVFLFPDESGGRETYIRRLLPALRAAAPDLRVTGITGRTGGGIDGLDTLVRLPVDARSRPAWALGEMALVAGAAARARVDLLFSPANFGPAFGPFARVQTVHDVGYTDSPASVALVGAGARRAGRVITALHASADDVAHVLSLDPGRIDIVPHGTEPPPAGRPPRTPRILLCVGSNLPHKDFATAVAAHARLPEPRPELVLAGKDTEALGGRGLVSAAELERLYSEAAALIVPSRYEGFGLPVLDAFAREVPVIASDLAVLRETSGGLAAFATPGDADAFAQAIIRTLIAPPNPALLRAHAAKFSWANAASGTLASFARALAQPPGSRV